MPTDLLFVYGTLRRGDGALHPLLRPWAEYLAAARIRGRLYRVGRYPALVLSQRNRTRVVGEVYRLHSPAQALRELDRYEECGPGFPAPAEYRRELRPVTLQYGHIVRAWVYIYNWRTDNLRRIASGNFLG